MGSTVEFVRDEVTLVRRDRDGDHGVDPDELDAICWDEAEDGENEQVAHNREIYQEDEDDEDYLDTVVVNAADEALDEVMNEQNADPMDAIDQIASWSWTWPLHERQSAARNLILTMSQQLQVCQRNADEHIKNARQLKADATAATLKQAVVIGGTIVGAAKRLLALRAAEPFAIVVEEACEVMEPTLAAVLAVESVQKLELIGDHMQLPAFVNNCWYDLAQAMPSIKVSLFERLVTKTGRRAPSKAVCTVLDVQRRMRRSIADLTRGEYADITEIQDDAVTATQKIGDRLAEKEKNRFLVQRDLWAHDGRHIPGVLPSVFFWNMIKNAQSKPKRGGISACNENEASAIGQMVRHFICCGVPPSSISVITPYKGQQRELVEQLRTMRLLPPFRKDASAAEEETIRVSTVDRYQGDENDIVILSLVRVQPGNQFVALLNRFIVATSRARLGFYVVGSTSAVENVKHWGRFLDRLKEPDEEDPYRGERVGDELPICCPCHPSSTRMISSEATQRENLFPKRDSWSQLCRVPCTSKLVCGHPCALPCHALNFAEHEKRCKVLLERPCNDHSELPLPCASLVFPKNATMTSVMQEWKCEIRSEYRRPDCTHSERLQCFEYKEMKAYKRNWPKCAVPAEDFIHPSCGHVFGGLDCDKRRQYESAPPTCQTEVPITLPCNHQLKVKCNEKNTVDRASIACKEEMTTTRPRCGHRLSLRCFMARHLHSCWQNANGIGVTERTADKAPIVVQGGGYGDSEATYCPESKLKVCEQKAVFKRECGHEEEHPCHIAFSMCQKPLPKCTQIKQIDCFFCHGKLEVPCHLAETLSGSSQGFHINVVEDLNTVDQSALIGLPLNKQEKEHWALHLPYRCKSAVGIRRSCNPRHIEHVACYRLIELILGRGGPLPNCNIKVRRVLDCGHAIDQLCHKLSSTPPVCKTVVDQDFIYPTCRHSQRVRLCGDLQNLRNCQDLKCLQIVNTHHLRCGHSVQVPCAQRGDVEACVKTGNYFEPSLVLEDNTRHSIIVREDADYCEPCNSAPICTEEVDFLRNCGHIVPSVPCHKAFSRDGVALTPCTDLQLTKHSLCGHNVSWPCWAHRALHDTWQPWAGLTTPQIIELEGQGDAFLYPFENLPNSYVPPGHVPVETIRCPETAKVMFKDCPHTRSVPCSLLFSGTTAIKCVEQLDVECNNCSGIKKFPCHVVATMKPGDITANCTNRITKLCSICKINNVPATACNQHVVECNRRVDSILPCGHPYSWQCGKQDEQGDISSFHDAARNINTKCKDCVIQLWLSDRDNVEVTRDVLITLGMSAVKSLLKGSDALNDRKDIPGLPSMQPYENSREVTIGAIMKAISSQAIPPFCPPCTTSLDEYVQGNYDIVYLANAVGKQADPSKWEQRFKAKDTEYGQGLKVKIMSKVNIDKLIATSTGEVDLWVAAAFRGNLLLNTAPFIPTSGPNDKKEALQLEANKKMKQCMEKGYLSVLVQTPAGTAGNPVAAAVDGDVEVNLHNAEYVYWKPSNVVPLFIISIKMQTQCAVCFEYLEKNNKVGALCANTHLVCWDCMGSYVEQASKPGAINFADEQGCLECPVPDCKLGYNGLLNAYHAPFAIGKALVDFEYNKRREKEIATVREEERVRHMEALEAMRRMSAEEREVTLLVQEIREKILCPQCPRCHQVFEDFDGCFALTCSNRNCRAGFCAWCFEDCGADAHGHVANCRHGNRNVYGDVGLLKTVWNKLRKEKIQALLSNKTPHIKGLVLNTMKVDFRDLGLVW